MKIEAIRLINFRNHEHTEVELGRVTIFAGPNAGGKSSIKQALEVALTGRCEATDRGGRGADDLIRVGEKAAEISVRLGDLGEVTRVISPTGSRLQVGDLSGTLKVQQELLYQKLGVDADLISALVNVGDYLRLAPKEQAAMLHKLIPQEEDPLAGLAPDLLAVLEEVAGKLPPSPGAEHFEAVYKRLYDARREAKKELDQARGRLEGLEASAAVQGPDPALLPEMRRQLAELEERKAELETQLAAARAAAERKLFLARQVERIRADIAEMEARLEELPEGEEESHARLDEAVTELGSLRGRSEMVAGEIRRIDQALAALKKAGGKCPLAPEVIACPLQGAELRKLTKDLNDQRKRLVTEHEQAQKEEARLLQLANELSKVVGAAAEAGQLAEEIEEARRELEGVEAEAAEETMVADESAVEAELAELASRIHRGHAMIAEAELAERNRETREQVAAAIEGLEARVEALERLVTLFGPGPEGIRSRQLSQSLAAIKERINANLETLTNGRYTLRLETEPEFHILVHEPAGVVGLRQLSNSERMRVGMAVAEALAHYSGLRLLVIDDAEILDAQNRVLATQFLLGLEGEYDTIMLLYTGERVRAEQAAALGHPVFWVEDGTVERIGVKEVVNA